jgi:hypothetical protein
VRALADALPGGPPDLRGYLALDGPALSALADRWLGRRPPAPTAIVRGPLRPSEAVLAGIERQAALLRALESAVPPGRVEALAAAHAGLALEHLAGGSAGTAATVRLLRGAARHAVHAGWAAHESGRAFAAQLYLRAALHAAQAAGDRPAGGFALLYLGVQALATGHVAAGLRLSEAATVRVPAGRTRDLLLAHRAVVLLAAGRDPAVVTRLLRGWPGDGRIPAPEITGPTRLVLRSYAERIAATPAIAATLGEHVRAAVRACSAA